MAQLRIISGGVTQRSAKALLIARASEPPRLRLERLAGGVETACSVTRQPTVDNALRRALEQRGIRVYLLAALDLAPGTAYRLKASIPGAPTVHADFDSLPERLPSTGLTIAVGSCYYDGYHRDAQLRAALALKQWGQVPAFQIWCGDNLYMDVPAQSHAHRPIEHTLSRYLEYLFDSDYALVRSLAPTFSAYDDHEFWNNYPEFQPWLSRTWPNAWQDYRSVALECLELFQSSLNPAAEPGQGYFQFDLRPLRFFFLDTRSFRVRGRNTDLITP
ncbi:MAG TPA: alkaline phosphatase D family protein, partial [Polyangiales bacterium]|nr:alkaline phosphatase D family protein [Polyangiales bacterium]